MHGGESRSGLRGDVESGGSRGVTEAAKRALRENTELHGRVAAMADTLQVRSTMCATVLLQDKADSLFLFVFS